MSADPTPPKKPAADAPKTFPVRRLTFASRTSVPGAGVRTDLRGDIEQTNVPRWTIEFMPALRHHRITYHPLTGADEVRMVHESRVDSWEPM